MTLYHKSLSFHQLPPTIENEQLETRYSYVSQSFGILEKPGHVGETAVRPSRKKETTFLSPNNPSDATQSAVTLGLEEENLHVPMYKTESKANNFSKAIIPAGTRRPKRGSNPNLRIADKYETKVKDRGPYSHGKKQNTSKNINVKSLSNNLQIQDKKKMADLVRLHRSAATVVYARYKTHLILQNNPQKREELTLSGEGVPRHCFSMNRTEQYEHSLPGVLCIPAYVIIGFPKTGSTSLWNYMSQHPQIRVYYKKEAHYFHKPKSFVQEPVAWYSYLRGYPRISRSDSTKGIILGDHTPGYVWRVPWNCKYHKTQHFGCANGRYPINSTAINILTMIPRAKLVILLRDPVDRAYSHFLHFEDPKGCEKRRRDPECFQHKVLYLQQKFNSCVSHEAANDMWNPICAWSPLGEDAWMQHDRALTLGIYVLFIKKWLQIFPVTQFCTLDLENFSKDIRIGMKLIEKCLGIKNHDTYIETSINRRATKDGVAPMLKKTRKQLESFYAPYNHALCDMKLQPMGCEPAWLANKALV